MRIVFVASNVINFFTNGGYKVVDGEEALE